MGAKAGAGFGLAAPAGARGVPAHEVQAIDHRGTESIHTSAPTGTSSGSISPCLLQPTESSQVRARPRSPGLGLAPFRTEQFHPPKNGADENTSGANARHAPCLRAFCNT